ncbi:ATP-grasp domain-containing protein [Methylocapsa palsarum]|uniref:Glutathione synthase/RimK-type ligase, ATP-grasp superfamily n=1 Tax=Methylocapsa palsarum TaxID=1612308 RepID=A0A1I4C2H3_9HYPH|nr:ATP-grasp domain-containing protein [Methylocapsa palsarum]SFK74637.1 Glutathione synthase/RimK-type ligase, ATP-grasp superfamily [Methylocapsa palsarum]
MKALLLAFSLKQQYHAMRCAQLAGYEVHVLGKNMARGLRLSRYCASYREMEFVPGAAPLETAVEEIAKAVRQIGADVVLPSDVVSTRLLTLIADRLPVRACSLPDPVTFAHLNDKWWFYNFCRKEDLPTPETWLFQTSQDLWNALRHQEIPLPLIVKPTNKMGSSGIFVIRTEAELVRLLTEDYRPVLAQRYVDGQDCGFAMVCDHGRVVAYGFQQHFKWGYRYEDDPRIRSMAERIAAATNYHGVAHFDVRKDALSGELTLIECNPRYWYSMFALALAGLNFVDLSLKTGSLDPANPLRIGKVDVYVNKNLIMRFLSGKPVTACDRRVLNYYLSDPIPILCERLRLCQDDRPGIAGSLDEQTSVLLNMALPANEKISCALE